jgi:ADP-ribose pyrophosphatase
MSADHSPTRVSARTTHFHCPFMEVYHQEAHFGDFSKDYFVVDFKRRGGVVAVRDGKMLLVRQYRFLVNATTLELPGGTIDDHEQAEAGLARECLEETGYEIAGLAPVLTYYPGLDNVDNRTLIYWTRDVRERHPFVANPAEIVALEWVPVDTCVDMVFDGRILDAMTVAGILGYALRVQRSPEQV